MTTPLIADGKFGSTNSMGFIRLANVPAGKHIITFTQTNVGAAGVAVVGVGAPRGQVTGTLPTVLAGTIPYQYDPKIGYCLAADPICLSYIQDIRDNVALFKGDGLDVKLCDTRKYMFGTAAEMDDELHPNALGHQELAKSVEAVW